MKSLSSNLHWLTTKTIPATVVCYVLSILFWYLWLVQFSYGILGIGLGLGGALYPFFFSLPVNAASLVYQIVLRKLVGLSNWNLDKKIVWSCLIPFVLIAIGLTFFCPTDSTNSYFQSLWQKLFGS